MNVVPRRWVDVQLGDWIIGRDGRQYQLVIKTYEAATAHVTILANAGTSAAPYALPQTFQVGPHDMVPVLELDENDALRNLAQYFILERIGL